MGILSSLKGQESGTTVPPEMNPSGLDEMLETQRSLFFKASYNWRI